MREAGAPFLPEMASRLPGALVGFSVLPQLPAALGAVAGWERGSELAATHPSHLHCPLELSLLAPCLKSQEIRNCFDWHREGLWLPAPACWESKATVVLTVVASTASWPEKPREGICRSRFSALPRQTVQVVRAWPQGTRTGSSAPTVAKQTQRPPRPRQAGTWPQAQVDPGPWEPGGGASLSPSCSLGRHPCVN